MTASITWTRRERPIDHGRFYEWARNGKQGWTGKALFADHTVARYQCDTRTIDQHLCEEMHDQYLANDLGECFYENWPGIDAFRAHHAGVASGASTEPWPARFERLLHMRPDLTVGWRPSTESDAVPGATFNPRTCSISFAGREYNCSPPDEHGVITFTVPAEDREVVQALQGKSVSVAMDWQEAVANGAVVKTDYHQPTRDARAEAVVKGGWPVLRLPALTPEMKELLTKMKDQPVRLENEPAWSRELSEKLQHEPVREYQPMSVGYALETGEPTLREHYCTCAMRNSCADAMPSLHANDCPVAPVPGLHGGMREHVAGDGWQYNDVAKKWTHGRRRVQFRDWKLSDLSRFASTWPREFDVMLGAFYLPPAQPDDQPARLPVDSDPELEGVAARATHEPERWKAVTR